MKILHITPQCPAKNSGGELGVLQTILSLNECGYDVDYVGPEIVNAELVKLYSKCYFLEKENHFIKRGIYLLQGISNSRYNAWKHLKIKIEIYDAIVLDFTKLDYVLSKIQGKKLIVKVHNVEYDYSFNDFFINKTFEKGIVALLSKKQENKILKSAESILVLTEKDKNRLVELYGKSIASKMYLNPVCIEEKNWIEKKKDKVLQLLISGSLWYGENANGVIWFVENVLKYIEFEICLVVAGAHPNDNLKNILNNYKNVRLIDTPDFMESYFQSCDLVVTPIFNGAGMKVKVAEAFAYGKPVLGTNHAFIGYEIENGTNSFIANKAEEFIKALNKINIMSEEEWKIINENVIRLYNEKYSIKNSAKQWQYVLEKSS